MPKYVVSPRFTKNLSEFNAYVHKFNKKKSFVFEVDYRSGSFAINLSKKEYDSIEKDSESGQFRPFDYDGCELIETDDSWSVFLRFEESSIPEDEQKVLEESFFEDGIDAFEDLGYVFDQAYYVLYGALDIEPIKANRKPTKAKDEGQDDIARLFGL